MSVTDMCASGDHDLCGGKGGGEWCDCGCHRVDSRPDTERHIAAVQSLLLQVASDLLRRAKEHDASKLEDPEKEGFDLWSPRLRDLEYGTPEYEEARAMLGVTLEHHYAHNDHHPEHHESGMRGMHLLQVIEMLADWKAAGMRHGDKSIPLAESIERNRERFGYDDVMYDLLMNTAEALGWL
jgi:hypothetical protein